MSTFKDITYKKEDDETWTEWTKRVPDNNQDKLDYIGETIYVNIYENDKEKAGKITGMLLELGVEQLILLLESNNLLEDKIKEAYEVLREDEIKMSEEDTYANEKISQGFFYHHKLEKWCEAANGGWEEYDAEVQAEYKENVWWDWNNENEEQEKKEEKEEKEQEQEQERNYEIYDHPIYNQPVTTITVADMIAALSKLPPDAKLVMTESGYYSKSDFAEVMLPKLYTVQNDEWQTDLPTGSQVYIIGHSHQ